jgi:catechol 2,3-dioxygenase-like lactoylglutathione lyase family enzyme
MPKIGHVLETCLYVDDLKRAKTFYRQTFDLKVVREDARMCAFAIGPTVLLLFQRGLSMSPTELPGGTIPPHDGAGPIHLALAISSDELAEWERMLEREGIAIEGRVQWPLGGSSIYFRDPDRHLIELATPGLWPNY